MKIIIAGAGEVGFHLAKLLSYESQDITLIDTKKESLAYADTHLDIRVVKGDATSISVLKDSKIASTDLVIAVTSSETTNITVCVLAKQLGAKRTVARISNTEFIEKKDEVGFTKFGIDELISPEALAANEIALLLGQSAFNDTYEFEDGALTMIGLNLSRTAAFVGKTVKEVGDLNPDLNYVPLAIQRFGTQYTLIPRGDTQFKEGDQVYFTTTEKGVEEMFHLTGKVREDIKNVMILGGSKIGYKTAQDLCKNSFKVKLIESSKDKAFDIADDIPSCLVINGDGRNVDLLQEESINEMDAFIAVTGNSETNIMSCLVAKSKGVKKTIALVENMDYYVRKGEVVAMTKLNNMNAELLEFRVTTSSKVCDKKIKDIDLPRSAVIGGVVRDGEGLIALGDFKIKNGDHIVICCLPQSINKVEKLFV